MSKIGDSARHSFLTNDFAYLFVCVDVIMCGCMCLGAACASMITLASTILCTYNSRQ